MAAMIEDKSCVSLSTKSRVLAHWFKGHCVRGVRESCQGDLPVINGPTRVRYETTALVAISYENTVLGMVKRLSDSSITVTALGP